MKCSQECEPHNAFALPTQNTFASACLSSRGQDEEERQRGEEKEEDEEEEDDGPQAKAIVLDPPLISPGTLVSGRLGLSDRP